MGTCFSTSFPAPVFGGSAPSPPHTATSGLFGGFGGTSTASPIWNCQQGNTTSGVLSFGGLTGSSSLFSKQPANLPSASNTPGTVTFGLAQTSGGFSFTPAPRPAGTCHSQIVPTLERDASGKCTSGTSHHVGFNDPFIGVQQEVLRWEDYQLGNTGHGPLAQPQEAQKPTGMRSFSSQPSLFGRLASFGTAATPLHGAGHNDSAFGPNAGMSTTGGLFSSPFGTASSQARSLWGSASTQASTASTGCGFGWKPLQPVQTTQTSSAGTPQRSSLFGNPDTVPRDNWFGGSSRTFPSAPLLGCHSVPSGMSAGSTPAFGLGASNLTSQSSIAPGPTGCNGTTWLGAPTTLRDSNFAASNAGDSVRMPPAASMPSIFRTSPQEPHPVGQPGLSLGLTPMPSAPAMPQPPPQRFPKTSSFWSPRTRTGSGLYPTAEAPGKGQSQVPSAGLGLCAIVQAPGQSQAQNDGSGIFTASESGQQQQAQNTGSGLFATAQTPGQSQAQSDGSALFANPHILGQAQAQNVGWESAKPQTGGQPQVQSAASGLYGTAQTAGESQAQSVLQQDSAAAPTSPHKMPYGGNPLPQLPDPEGWTASRAPSNPAASQHAPMNCGQRPHCLTHQAPLHIPPVSPRRMASRRPSKLPSKLYTDTESLFSDQLWCGMSSTSRPADDPLFKPQEVKDSFDFWDMRACLERTDASPSLLIDWKNREVTMRMASSKEHDRCGEESAGQPVRLTIVGGPSTGQLSEGEITKLLPRIRDSEYYTRPDARGLANMLRGDGCALKRVHGLTVGRSGYGEVKFLEPVDIEGIDVCDTVTISRGMVSLYETWQKPDVPAVGEGLNQPAEVRLLDIFKRDKKGAVADDDCAKAAFERRLVKYCRKVGADFVSYDREEGVWIFRVNNLA
ncbi:unnamed protein product [Ostreobium quekettii]|uniref:Peptidase S59 domain-containing protein n=1 Tax=Ostreobium quekettii TaxID=121088 RepID=A0A8S1JAM6_9CHLO|nr:unnamed protein product [Ostreobium quekettii]